MSFLSTRKGIYIKSKNSFCISSSEDRAWGVYSFYDSKHQNQFKIIMLDFDKDTDFIYDYNHHSLPESLLVVESHNLVISGASDGVTVFHDLTSGKTQKIVKLTHGSVRSLCKLNSVVAVANEAFVSFIDMEKREIIYGQDFKSRAYSISCLESSHDNCKSVTTEDLYLFLCGNSYKKLERVTISREILNKGM